MPPLRKGNIDHEELMERNYLCTFFDLLLVHQRPRRLHSTTCILLQDQHQYVLFLYLRISFSTILFHDSSTILEVLQIHVRYSCWFGYTIGLISVANIVLFWSGIQKRNKYICSSVFFIGFQLILEI